MIINKRVEDTDTRDFLDTKHNMINRTVLDEWNDLFDGILSLSVVDDRNQSITYGDVCARRLGKCSIEGGLVRSEKFQSKLLGKKVSIAENDGKSTYIDAEEQDAINFPLTFGKLIKLHREEMRGSNVVQLVLIHTGIEIFIKNSCD